MVSARRAVSEYDEWPRQVSRREVRPDVWPHRKEAIHITAHETLAERALSRHYKRISIALRETLAAARQQGLPAPASQDLLDTFYGQIDYHFGWRDSELREVSGRPGKLLRPSLLLLACELAAGHAGASPKVRNLTVVRALPAAVAVELVHNFSLVHDDIVDHDSERHGRTTLWKVWGASHGINTGDGIFTLARMQMARLADHGVPPRVVFELMELLDRTCLALCEGQFLDLEYEGRHAVTTAQYFEMIARKTASLIACSAALGARLGAPNDGEVVAGFTEFGLRLGMAFQVRDDLLGIWAAESLGKSTAGDIRRKKMSLPVITALEDASPADRERLRAIYSSPGPATEDETSTVLTLLEEAGAHTRTRKTLREQCGAARQALAAVAGGHPSAREAHEALIGLLAFVEADAD